MGIGPLPPLDILGAVISKTDTEVVVKGTTADGEGVRLVIDGATAAKYFRDGEKFRVHFVPLPDEAAKPASD